MLKSIANGLGVALTLVLSVTAVSLILIDQEAQAQNASLPSSGELVAEQVITDPSDPRVQQLQADYNAAISADLSNYRVAYLAQENSIAADNLVATGVELASTWEEAMSLDASAPLQAIVIHSSAVGSVDSEWVHAAYRRGVIVVGVDLFFPELSALTGDNCTLRHGIATNTANTHSGDYFVLYYYHLQPVNEADREAINAAKLQNCLEPANSGFVGEHGYQLQEGFMQGTLDDAFTRTLAFYLHTLNVS
jgi:hypothetical protein